MNEVWNLDPIYKGFDDPAYAADMERMKQLVADFTAFTAELPKLAPIEGLRRGIAMQEKLAELSTLHRCQRPGTRLLYGPRHVHLQRYGCAHGCI